MMHPRRFGWCWAVVISMLAALLAPTAWGDSAVAQSDSDADEAALLALVDAMSDAILSQDRETYVNYVDLSDPIFLSEHTYWIDDWMDGNPMDRFAMTLADITVTDDTATGSLTIVWARDPDVSYREAEFPALFVRAEDGAWQYAGGAWHTLETEHFLVHVFPGMEPVAEELIAMLPEIYEHATTSLNHVPDAQMHIKLYDHPDDLGAMIALSLPQIRGWNEPGESLKLLVLPDEAPSPAVMAHELTHFLTFDMANTTDGNYPWWLSEGICEYVASTYWTPEYMADRMEIVAFLAETGQLAPWDKISDFEATPVELWRFVYPQGYVFVRYVSEVYGEAARNDWLWAMAGESDIEAASEAALGVTFETLETGFLGWIADQS
jgi:hypothetical protein